jgi:hypothetical protein
MRTNRALVHSKSAGLAASSLIVMKGIEMMAKVDVHAPTRITEVVLGARKPAETRLFWSFPYVCPEPVLVK